MRAVLIRCILPLKPVLDDVYDAADDASVIDTRSTVRTGKERFDTLQLAFGKINLSSPLANGGSGIIYSLMNDGIIHCLSFPLFRFLFSLIRHESPFMPDSF